MDNNVINWGRKLRASPRFAAIDVAGAMCYVSGHVDEDGLMACGEVRRLMERRGMTRADVTCVNYRISGAGYDRDATEREMDFIRNNYAGVIWLATVVSSHCATVIA